MAKSLEERRADGAAYMRAQRAAFPEKYRQKSKDFNVKHNARLRVERNARYAANKADIRARRHGTTKFILDAVLVAQDGKCAICEKPLDPWPSSATHIDHCHDTGRVRGLLCRSCNMKEGWVRRYGAALEAYLKNPPAFHLEDIA